MPVRVRRTRGRRRARRLVLGSRIGRVIASRAGGRGMVGRKVLLLAALAGLATEAAAATVSVTNVERLGPGSLRIGVRYVATAAPSFRLVPVCRAPAEADWI